MKKYKKYKDNPEYEFVPYSNNPQYAMGGSNSNKLHKFGQFAGNALKTSADSMLSTFGLDNVISDDMYKGGSANDFIKIGNVMGGINKTIVPIAASFIPGVGPAASAAVSGIQQVGSQFNPEEEEQQQDMQYAMGGMYQGQPNAEIEGGGNGTAGEVVNYPDGTTDQAFGERHENGGVPVNLPQATRIFSDRLKMFKKTFAKIAQRYKTNREEAILKDTTSSSLQKKTAQLNMSTKNKKLDEIFNMQEMMKSKRINSYIKRYGGTQMYPDGGTHNPYVSNPNYVSTDWLGGGSPSNLNDPDFGPGTQSRYDIRQIPQSGYPKTSIDPNSIQKFNPKSRYSDYINTFEPNKSLQNFSELSPDSGLGNSPDITFDQAFPNKKKPPVIPPNSNNKKMLGKAGTEIGLGLLNNAGNLAYLAQNGRDYDKVNYGSVTPELPTDRDSQREIREAYSTGVYNLKNSGRLTQAGLVGLTGEKMKAAAGSRERIGNMIADIRNQTNMFNKQTQIRGMQDEAGNKGVADTNYYTALNSIGQNVASQRGDYLSGQMDQKKLNLIKDYFPDYVIDPETFQPMYKYALQQSKIKKPVK